MRTMQRNICCELGCDETGVYLDDKAKWHCEKHKPAKLYLWEFDKNVLSMLTINNEKMSIYDIAQALHINDEFKVQEAIGRLEVNGLVELAGFRDIYREDGGAISLALYQRCNPPLIKKSCDEGCHDCEGTEGGRIFSVSVKLSECQVRAMSNHRVIGDGMKEQILDQVFSQIRSKLPKE